MMSNYFWWVWRNLILQSNIIQKIFTKLRGALNEREDELLLIINEKYKNSYFGDDIIKENEKLPNQIKMLLENNKKNEHKWINNDE